MKENKNMKVHVEGLHHWGLAYAPPTPTGARAAVEPDFSFENYIQDFGAPNTVAADWAKHTSLHLDAPWPIGSKIADKALLTHWHSPSEHTVWDNHYDLELHFAFAGDLSDPYTVMGLAIMFDRLSGEMENTENPFITTVLDAWKTRDAEGDARRPMDFSLLAKQVMDMDDSFTTYVGSTTSPECTNGLTLIVPTKVLSISQTQLNDFQKYSPANINGGPNGGKGNNRATQPRDLEAYPVWHKPAAKREHRMKDEMMEKMETMMHKDEMSMEDMMI